MDQFWRLARTKRVDADKHLNKYSLSIKELALAIHDKTLNSDPEVVIKELMDFNNDNVLMLHPLVIYEL